MKTYKQFLDEIRNEPTTRHILRSVLLQNYDIAGKNKVQFQKYFAVVSTDSSFGYRTYYFFPNSMDNEPNGYVSHKELQDADADWIKTIQTGII